MSKKDNRDDYIDSQIKSLLSTSNKNVFNDRYKDIIVSTGKNISHIEIDKLYDAKSEWNFFPEISEDKMIEMIFSILENGLFNPIIVWKQKTDNYMILSGHNRVNAYKRILKEYREVENFKESNYKKIPAIIYSENEIDEKKAKEIIIDTNYIQRNEDRRLLPIIIKNRMKIVGNRKDKKGRTIQIVAEEMGLSKTKVYEDYIIYNKLIEEFQELYYDGRLIKKAVLRLTWFDKKMQKWIYDNFLNKINNEKLMRLKKSYNKDVICRLFNEKEKQMIKVKVMIPKELETKFQVMVKEWLKAKLIEDGDKK